MKTNEPLPEELHQAQALELANGVLAHEFDHIARLARTSTASSAAAVCALGPGHINVLSEVGMPSGRISRAASFSEHVIADGQLFEVEDARADNRFRDHPMVQIDNGLRSYCGVPYSINDVQVGVVFVVDSQPRALTVTQKNALEDLAQIVTDKFASHLGNRFWATARLTADEHIGKAGSAGPQGYELLAHATHKLRVLLRTMLNESRLIGNEHERNGQLGLLRHVARLESAGIDMVDLLDRLFEVSRLELAPIAMEFERISLSALVDSAVQAVEPIAIAHGIHIDQEKSDLDVHAFGDHAGLARALHHLLSNAVVYNRVGGAVTVSVQRLRNGCAISVSDQGAGLSRNQIDQLFQPLHRLNSQKQCSQHGAGLGLVISDRLIRAMAGRISVRSQPGKGSTFTIELPRAIR